MCYLTYVRVANIYITPLCWRENYFRARFEMTRKWGLAWRYDRHHLPSALHQSSFGISWSNLHTRQDQNPVQSLLDSIRCCWRWFDLYLLERILYISFNKVMMECFIILLLPLLISEFCTPDATSSELTELKSHWFASLFLYWFLLLAASSADDGPFSYSPFGFL